jgi:FkbM family methyltransferase
MQICFKQNKEYQLMKIGKRSLNGFIQRLIDINSYRSIPQFLYVHQNPLRAMIEEISSSGTYPRSVKINTPIGNTEISLYSVADFSTLNLVFCRQDYYTPKNIKVVIDIGSNIGTSAMYWLTRNQDSIVHCYEPSPISCERLDKNLSRFGDRYRSNKVAVSNFTGKAPLGIETSGVYSSLDYHNYTHKTFTDYIECDVININDVLENVLGEHDKIDVLKIDSEGHELRTVQAIDNSFWAYISCLNVERCGASQYVPSDFICSTVSSSERFYRD